MQKLWERVTPGRPRRFSDPSELWEAAVEYFEWCDENPLQEEKLWQFQGEVIRDSIDKMRAMTYAGLFIHMNLPESTWYDYTKRDEYSGVCDAIDKIMREQKFTGAAADLLNPAIIARDLGLVDKKEFVPPKETKDIEDGTPPAEAARAYEATLNAE